MLPFTSIDLEDDCPVPLLQLKGDGFTVNQPTPMPGNCIEPRFDLFLALTFFSFPRYRRANECRQSDPQFRGVVGSSD